MNIGDWHMLLRSVIALGVVLILMVGVLHGLKLLQDKVQNKLLARLSGSGMADEGHKTAAGTATLTPKSIPKITSRVPLDLRRQLVNITWGETEILLLVGNTSETVLATRTIPSAPEQPQTTPPS